MNRSETVITITVDGNIYTGTLKVVPNKWCFVNQGEHYFKIFSMNKSEQVSILGDRINTIPLSQMVKELLVSVQAATYWD